MSLLLWTIKKSIGPTARVGHALAFDTARRRTVLFGGQSSSGVLGDTWEWDGESWTQIADLGPSPRQDHAMVFDQARGRIVLFGGSLGTADTATTTADTWEWDGQAWTQVAIAGPGQRAKHAVAFLGEANGVLLFGGEQAGSLLNDTWQWQGREWVQLDNVGPSPRRGHAMAFDSLRRRVVLFGGEGATVLGDTWQWNGRVWTQVSDFGPPARTRATLISDGRRLVLYGGIPSRTTGAIAFHETWQWNGRHWTARQDLGPGPRQSHAMAYDTIRGRGVLFGGAAGVEAGPATVFLGDTWEEFERATDTDDDTEEPTDDRIQSFDISPREPVEGQPLAATLSFDQPTTEPTAITMTVRRDGLSMGSFVVGSVEAGVTTQTIELTGLAEGDYEVQAELGSVSRSITFTVSRNPDFRVVALVADPASVPVNGSFMLRAQISGPAPAAGLRVPTLLILDANHLGPSIPIASGSDTGELNLDAQENSLFGVPGRYRLRAQLGGASADAELEVQPRLG